MSDYSITIRSEPSSDNNIQTVSEKTYYVHKLALVSGERKSDYFRNVFQSDMVETASSSSIIHVSAKVAEYFEELLDYIYHECNMHINDIVLTSDNAVPLYWLADYFAVSKLTKAVDEFITTDMKDINVSNYLCQAISIFGEQGAMSKFDNISNRCAKHFKHVSASRVCDIHPSVLLNIVESADFTDQSKIHYGGIVGDYMKSHPHLDKESHSLFCRLVCCKVLPFLRLNDALYFLEKVCKRDDEICVACKSSNSLLKRCFEASSRNWRTILNDELDLDRCDIDFHIVKRMLLQSLQQSKAEHDFLVKVFDRSNTFEPKFMGKLSFTVFGAPDSSYNGTYYLYNDEGNRICYKKTISNDANRYLYISSLGVGFKQITTEPNRDCDWCYYKQTCFRCKPYYSLKNTGTFPPGENEIWYDIYNNTVDLCLVYNYNLLDSE